MDTPRTIFTPYQLKMLSLSKQIKSDEEMAEINQILTDYFAKKAQKAVDKLWEDGVINDETIEQWKDEHMRTPYKV